MREYFRFPVTIQEQFGVELERRERRAVTPRSAVPAMVAIVEGVAINFGVPVEGRNGKRVYRKDEVLRDWIRLAQIGFENVPILLEHREDQQIGKCIAIDLSESRMTFKASLDKFHPNYPEVASGLQFGTLGFSTCFARESDSELLIVEISICKTPADSRAVATRVNEVRTYLKKLRAPEPEPRKIHRSRPEPLWRGSDQSFAW